MFVIFVKEDERERCREWNPVMGTTRWCRPCVLTVDRSGSQQENKWVCSILKCAVQLSSLHDFIFNISFFLLSSAIQKGLWWMVNNPELFWGMYEVMLVRQENGLCQEVSRQHFKLSTTKENEKFSQVSILQEYLFLSSIFQNQVWLTVRQQ